MTSDSRWLWILNPDAEIEFERAARGRRYAPSAALIEEMARRRDAFSALVRGDAWTFAHDFGGLSAAERELSPIYWCPTPLMQARARDARLPVPVAPVSLARVHQKTFLSEGSLRTLPGRSVLRSVTDFERLTDFPEFHGLSYAPGLVRLKKLYGFSGRGQRTVSRLSASEDDERWLFDSLRQGLLVVEPEILSARLGSIHGVVVPEGAPLIGRPLFDSLAPPVESRESSAREQAEIAAEALRTAGYFGPFGLDFIVAESGEALALDLNPRFTLRWSEGMADERDRAVLVCSRLAHPC